MAESQGRELEESKRHRSVAQNVSTEGEYNSVVATPLYTPSIPVDASTALRGNSSQRSSALLGMQQTHGNHAVQRYVHGPSHTNEDARPTQQEIGPQGGLLPDDIAQNILSLRPVGSPMPGEVRSEMESAFGESLHDVRIHTGEESDMLNRRLGANAFTTGSDIFFRDGADPGDTRLLAHELTHVIQQRGSNGAGPLSVGPAVSDHEQEAHRAASNVTGGISAQVHTSSGPTIARDLFDGLGVGDWKIKPTFSGSTDDRYDTPENRRRAEMKDADKRSNDPSPPNWWSKPKYDPSAPLPWMPTPSVKGSDSTVAPPKSPDDSPMGPGDYPEDTLPEDEEYA